jgi:hypothetical protein
MDQIEEGATPEERIAALKIRHRELDEEITALVAMGSVNALRVQSLKKQKLALKDVIAKLESDLLPYIIA